MTIKIEPSCPLALIDGVTGELVEIDLSPVSLETAGQRLPQIDRAIRILRDHKTFLEGIITSSFEPGQTEQRIGDQIYEYRAESEWVVSNEPELHVVLQGAFDRGQITDGEYEKALTVSTVRKFNHATLNVLSKRLPRINDLRVRVDGAAKLRMKK